MRDATIAAEPVTGTVSARFGYPAAFGVGAIAVAMAAVVATS
jgi:hypothetical protein